eukprot:Seg650.10 transcript_id=Seg650.10/GoldUCD/mRNA.D3Y31 product="hypothetical protein" protein_id=Seg650.10/GoldUCD/D3Y31
MERGKGGQAKSTKSDYLQRKKLNTRDSITSSLKMVEDKEEVTLPGGCFVNLCEIGEDLTSPRTAKRKQAMTDFALPNPKEIQYISKEVISRPMALKKKMMNFAEVNLSGNDVKTAEKKNTSENRIESEDVRFGRKSLGEREGCRRKHGIVLGVDPKVDEYVHKLKNKGGEANCVEGAKASN